MQFNPCGLAVDCIRAPFTTQVRPFTDSDLVVKQRWYRVPVGSACLEYPTIFNNRCWESEDYDTGDVGEIDRPYRKFDKRLPPVIGDVDHICGTPDQFRYGQLYNPALPPTLYAADGLPLCCRPPLEPILMSGIDALILRSELLMSGSSWYCRKLTAIWSPTVMRELMPFPADPFPRFWRSADAEVSLWAPGQPPFTGPNDWLLYSATTPYFNTRWVTSSWTGNGCRVFTRTSGGGPDTVEVCCG